MNRHIDGAREGGPDINEWARPEFAKTNTKEGGTFAYWGGTREGMG